MRRNDTTNRSRRHGSVREAAVAWLLLLLSAVAAPAAVAQESATGPDQGAGEGRLLGRVVEASSGNPIPSAEVQVAGGPSTVTDLNGRFIFRSIPAGVVDVTVQALGHASKTVRGVRVSVGEMTTLDISLQEQAITLDAIRVTAEREQGSTSYLLDERRTADGMVESVGSQEIGRRPDSDAADVAQRMAGVTVAEVRLRAGPL